MCNHRIASLAMFAALLVCVLANAQEKAKTKHPYNEKDWAALHSAGAVAVSGSGTILYRVSYCDTHGPTHMEWWTIGSDGGGATKLDLPEGFSPAGFTRDGKSLYGAWKVNDTPQFAIFALKDGKASAAPATVVVLPRGVSGMEPSPDGKRFALVADPRPPDVKDSFRHVWDPDESSIYVVNADGTAGAWWCTSMRHVASMLTVGGNGGALAWNSTGTDVAMLSTEPKMTHHDVESSVDVCSASGVRHVASIGNSVSGIAWMDGGKTLAFLSTKTGTQTPEHVWTVSAAGGTAEDRTPDLQGTAVQLGADVQGRVWAAVERGVQTEVDEFTDGALKTKYTWPEGTISGLPVRVEYAGETEHAAFTVGDPTHTPNVAVVEGDGLKRITHEGDTYLTDNVELGPVKPVHWKSKEGVALEGIATFPAGYEAGKKYPFLVLPHGGPEANDELRFDPLSRFAAGLGYVVLQPEYRGSTGYGQDFLAAIYQHFGDRAYADVDSATDYAVAEGWADPNRLAIFGWSAGGFMTSWTVTQTHRYKAAVEGAGITDWAPFIWTSDVPQTDFDARWTDEDPEAFRRFSAMAFAKNVTTPLLILHGEADVRVPTFQGMEYFEILAARGKTVRMVTYPGSGHFPTLWQQRLNVMEELRDWLKKYNP